MNYVTVLLGKTSGNSELASILFNKLFKELDEQSQIIEQALESNNYTLAQQVTHKLHGSVSFCGFTDIQELAKAMEISLSENNITQIPGNFQQLKNKIIRFLALKSTIENQLLKKHSNS